MKLSDRVSQLKPSPTLVLVAKGKALKAEGHDVISLSVGEPDWPSSSSALKAGMNAIEGGNTRYTPAPGMLELRQAIAKQTSSDTGIDYTAENVTVTAGAKFILSTAIQCTVNAGESVLVPTPYWVSYPAMVELVQGKTQFIQTSDSSDFKLTASDLERHISAESKVLFLNSPSNPTGMQYSKEELSALAEVLRPFKDILIISDDIYNRLVFGAELAPHLLQVAPDLADRTLCVNGVSKSYAMTGWRIGWGVGPADLVKAMSSFQSQALGCASSISQAASLAAIENCEEELKKSRQILSERRQFLIEKFSNIDGLKILPPDGAFYFWVDIRSFLGKTYNGEVIEDSRTFCNILLEKFHVVVVPGAEFGAEGYFRMSFAVEIDRLGQALERINQFLAELK